MKIPLIILVIIIGGILVLPIVIPQLLRQDLKKTYQEDVISLKGMYEGIGEVPDTKPIAVHNYDGARLQDLADLQQALNRYMDQNPNKTYPRNTQEYLGIIKFYQGGGSREFNKDPLTNKDYCYKVSEDGKSYTITTILQWVKKYGDQNNVDNSQICTYPEGMKVICSPEQKCYQVKSP